MIKKKIRRRERDDDEDNGFAAWGGYMAAKKSKLEDQFLQQVGNESKPTSHIFKGVAIFVNGYTVPTADELKRIMVLHGGVYCHYESHRTTHIIASNLPDTKVRQLKTLNVVKPSWIVDSLAAGSLLDYRKYLLYSNQTKSQPRLNFAEQSSNASRKDTSSFSSEGTDRTNITKITEQSKRDKNQSLSNENMNVPKNPCTADFQQLENKNKKVIETSEGISINKPNCERGKESVGDVAVSPLKITTPGAPRRTAKEPEFLSEFYGNSRLHHLSTMGAMFKDYVTRLRQGSQGDFPGIQRLADWKKNNGVSSEDGGGEDELVDDLLDETFFNRGMKTITGSRTIMHIDMDCFFVSVGLRNRPELRDLPVAVTHAKGNSSRVREGANRQYERDFYKQRFQNRIKQRQNGTNVEEEDIQRKSRLDDVSENDSLSEIASCNYEARKAGVKNGMFFGTAIKLCPDLKSIPYDFEGYKEVSYMLYDTLASYTLDIEAVSCDEMYVDCTDILKKANVSALEFSSFLREEIKGVTGCTASAGFGSNPLQARLATKRAKPNGQFQLLPSDVEFFMHGIKVEDLPGVGYSLAYRLHAEGIMNCRDLQRLPLTTLQKKFGAKTGEALHLHASGKDDRALDVSHQRKSVSAEVNYGIRFSSQVEAEAFLRQLAEEVVSRMRQVHVRGRQVTLKLMVRAKDAPVETAKFMGHGACDNVSRSTSLGAPTDDASVIYREAVALERQLKVPPCDLRGVGIQMSRLVHLAAKGAVKSTLLTNFLARAGGDKEKEKKESGMPSKGKETSAGQSCSTDIQSKSTASSAPYANIAGQKDKSSSGTVDAANLCLTQEKKMENRDRDSVPKQSSCERKETTPCRSLVASESEKDVLPVLKPPVEVPMMTLAQARKLIRAWVMSEVHPQKCDVVMFASYIQRLVLAHRLEDVDILYSFLHRLLINRGRLWKSAYGNIVENTQAIMQAVYGADLKVPEFD